MVLRGSMCILRRSGECRAEMDFTRKRVLVRGSRKQESAKRAWGLEKAEKGRHEYISQVPGAPPRNGNSDGKARRPPEAGRYKKKKGKDGEMDPACGSPA